MLVLFSLLHVGEYLPNALRKARRNWITIGEIHIIEVHLGQRENLFEQAFWCRVAVMVKQVPWLGDVALRVGSQLGHVTQSVKEMSVTAARIGASQRRVAALAEEARADLLDGHEVI